MSLTPRFRRVDLEDPFEVRIIESQVHGDCPSYPSNAHWTTSLAMRIVEVIESWCKARTETTLHYTAVLLTQIL
jgi:hypothetical protein